MVYKCLFIVQWAASYIKDLSGLLISLSDIPCCHTFPMFYGYIEIIFRRIWSGLAKKILNGNLQILSDITNNYGCSVYANKTAERGENVYLYLMRYFNPSTYNFIRSSMPFKGYFSFWAIFFWINYEIIWSHWY